MHFVFESSFQQNVYEKLLYAAANIVLHSATVEVEQTAETVTLKQV